MEGIANEVGCLGTQSICKTHENNVVGFVHLLRVHAAATRLRLVSLLIICQFHHWSMNTVVSINPCSGEKNSGSSKDFFDFCYLCEGLGNK